MPLTELTITKDGDFSNSLNSFKHGQSSEISVDNDADIDIVVIDVRDVVEAAIQIRNKHASNSLTYTLYGSCQNVVPAAFTAEDFEAISGASAAVASDATAIESVTKGYSWILVRAKRTAAGQTSTIQVDYHGSN